MSSVVDENVLQQLPTLKNRATSHKILDVWLLLSLTKGYIYIFSCFIQVLLWFLFLMFKSLSEIYFRVMEEFFFPSHG